MKIIDVLLVCYNQEQYIRQAVESIILQHIPENWHMRVIVADDCSKDRTLDIIRECEKQSKVPFFYLPCEHNMGISKNYQRAFSACIGKYIAILEGDDYWFTYDHLVDHIAFLDANPLCSMSMNCITIMRAETEETLPAWWQYDDDEHIVSIKEQITEGNQLGNLSACVLRKDCVQKLPQDMFKLYLADWMLGVMLVQQGPIGLFKKSSSVYRTNAQSQWASLSWLQKKILLLKLAKQYDAFQDRKYHEYWKQFIKRTRKEMFSRKKYLMPSWLYRFLKNIFRNNKK